MKKIYFIFVVMFLLVLILSFVSSAVYPAPFVSTDVPQDSEEPWKLRCPEGYTSYSWTEKTDTSPTGFSTTHACRPIAPEMGNIQSNLQSKMGSSVGTTSTVSSETNRFSFGNSDNDFDDLALLQELDNPLEFKKREDCNKSNGCYKDGVCFPIGDIFNLTYCFEGQFINQRGWSDGCDFDYQCLSGFCYEERCYSGGREAYINSLQNNLNKLEEKIDSIEEDFVLEENSIVSMTGAVVGNKENIKSEGIIKKFLNWIKDIFN